MSVIRLYDNSDNVVFEADTSTGEAGAPTLVGGESNDLRIWVGTEAQFSAVSPKDANTIYIRTA